MKCQNGWAFLGTRKSERIRKSASLWDKEPKAAIDGPTGRDGHHSLRIKYDGRIRAWSDAPHNRAPSAARELLIRSGAAFLYKNAHPLRSNVSRIARKWLLRAHKAVFQCIDMGLSRNC